MFKKVCSVDFSCTAFCSNEKATSIQRAAARCKEVAQASFSSCTKSCLDSDCLHLCQWDLSYLLEACPCSKKEAENGQACPTGELNASRYSSKISGKIALFCFFFELFKEKEFSLWKTSWKNWRRKMKNLQQKVKSKMKNPKKCLFWLLRMTDFLAKKNGNFYLSLISDENFRIQS